MPIGKGTEQGGAGRAGGGRGGGRGAGRGAGGGGGRMGGNRAGAGPGGSCLCPNCGAKAPHTPGVPCSKVKCPECGTPMARE